MATSRLRKTFKYPSDAMLDDDDPSDLDEQSQESLISSLSTSNDAANTLYTRIFTLLPLLACLPFLWTLFITAPSHGALGAVFLPCILGVTSLGVSSLVMGFVPLNTAAGDGAGGEGVGKGTLSDIARAQSARRHAVAAGRGARLGVELPFCVPVDAAGPVARYAMGLNGVVCVGMGVFGVMFMGGNSAKMPRELQGFWMLCWVPGVMWVVVRVVRGAMEGVERGVGELKGLRYGLKGA